MSISATTVTPGGLTILKRPTDGVDMYGLYFEFVNHFKPGVGVSSPVGSPRFYYRVFVVGDTLSTYRREADKKSTVWKFGRGASPAATRERAIKVLQAPHTILRGEPVLVQLRASDILAMEKNLAPGARYEGQKHVERTLGKFDPASWITLVKQEYERMRKVAEEAIAMPAATPAGATSSMGKTFTAVPGTTPAAFTTDRNVTAAALEALVKAAEAEKDAR